MFLEIDPFLALKETKALLNLPFYIDIIILFCWNIWMQRNDLIFKGVQISTVDYYRCFKDDFALDTQRAKARHKSAMLE